MMNYKKILEKAMSVTFDSVDVEDGHEVDRLWLADMVDGRGTIKNEWTNRKYPVGDNTQFKAFPPCENGIGQEMADIILNNSYQ